MSYEKLRNLVQEIWDKKKTKHETIIVPATAKSPDSKQPVAIASGSLIFLKFTVDNDAAYRTIRLSGEMISGTLGAHVHWTKSQDTDQSTKNVKWRLEYNAWNGFDEDATLTSSSLDFEDTYDSNHTGVGRIVYAGGGSFNGFSKALDGIITGDNNYLSMKISAIAPASNELDEPALVSVDLVWDEYINR